MKVTTEEVGKVTMIRLAGRMVVGEGDVSLREAVRAALDGGARRICLDMREVPWLDSGSIGEVVAVYKRVRDREGKLALVITGKAHDLFTLYELQRILDVHESTDGALASFV